MKHSDERHCNTRALPQSSNIEWLTSKANLLSPKRKKSVLCIGTPQRQDSEDAQPTSENVGSQTSLAAASPT